MGAQIIGAIIIPARVYIRFEKATTAGSLKAWLSEVPDSFLLTNTSEGINELPILEFEDPAKYVITKSVEGVQAP